jgi:hypothetical protein
MVQTSTSSAPRQEALLSAIVPTPGAVGWLLDSTVARELIQDGAKVRIKTAHSEDSGTILHPHQVEIEDSTRVIFSAPGRAFAPGRRLAEVTSRVVTTPDSSDTFEAISVTIFGPNRSLFHRERLFDGPVRNREEALSILNEHFKKDV